MAKLNKLKQENSTLALQSKQVREGAIDALIEKEKKIMELSEEIQNTEQYYKSQLDLAREEIKMLQERFLSIDMKSSLNLEKQKTMELQTNLENERKQLLKRIEILEEELEEKEKENRLTILNLEKTMSEDNEKRIGEQVKMIMEKDHKIYNTMDTLDKVEEKSNHYEIICLNLQEKIKSLDLERENEIAEIKQKHELVMISQNEQMQNLKDFYEKKIEDVKKEAQNAMAQKNEYIVQQEKSKDNLLNRITELENDNKRKFNENASLLNNNITLAKQNLLVQKTLDEVASKQESYIKELKTKFDSEKQLLNFELRHIKKLTVNKKILSLLYQFF